MLCCVVLCCVVLCCVVLCCVVSAFLLMRVCMSAFVLPTGINIIQGFVALAVFDESLH